MKEMNNAEAMVKILDAIQALTARSTATQLAMNAVLRVLPQTQRAQFCTSFREELDSFLGATMDHPGGIRTIQTLTLNANNYLEAAGEPPRASKEK